MNEIKKTTLHPDSQSNVDLYPKTSADQVESLDARIKALSTQIYKVSIDLPKGAKNGNITQSQLNILQASEFNCIEMKNDNEIYYLNDPGHEEGFLTYSHVGIENSKTTIKTLTITVSAKSFVIVTTVVPTGSGKVYMHSMEFAPDSSAVTAYYLYFYSTFNTSITYDNVNEYTNQIPFGILNYVDENGDFKFSSIITGIGQGSPGKIIFSKPGIGTQLMLKLNSDNVTEV